ncbi:DUF2188 domain-containing protein [Sporosarcina sp. Te-1]|uniref:DUF2188 domain-containing protein n=1 Tax=Sporosarcina sp. Te-1 TaxID=2818390 RepID=UPI001616E0B8|nr:DUF2188 domain-containing protein [Sporosarcina sp. Te-1]MBB4824683.1 hypothetical protein [Sporosarcina luteola]QTD40060.1 DUF2188 domain-containing protein [Sporosarcina sp. Te-1]
MADKQKRDQDEYFEDRAGTDDARFHVVPHDEDGWAVKKEGNDDPAYTSGSRDEAVDEAKRMAEKAGTMVYIHGDDGKIEKQLEYGD